jgi:amino acid transporter
MESSSGSAPPGQPRLEAGAMGVADIVFFVLAAVAPVGVIVAITTLSVALGDGGGVPATYLIAGLVLCLFAVGYVRMSRHVTNAGAFYAYISAGLGRVAGSAAAYVAVISYNAATIGVLGALAYFAHVSLGSVLHIHMAWQLWALIFFVLVAGLSYREVTLSAKVLGLALAAEVAVLLALDIGVLADKGFHGFSLEVFKPSVVFSSGFGVSLMLAFGSFIGFEATAIYAEEAKDRARTVKRATYIAIVAISVFYVLTTWALISAYGVHGAQAAAQKNPAAFAFGAEYTYVGHFATDAMQVLVVTSLFAAFLAFHANTSRYHFALARDGLLPRKLAYTHPKYDSPLGGSIPQLVLTAIVTIGFALAHQDPYLKMSASLYGMGLLGIVALMGATSFATIRYFLARQTGESRLATLACPLLGGVGLAAGLVLMVENYSTLTSSTVTWINELPWLLAAAAIAGVIVALIRRPTGTTDIDHAAHTTGEAAAERHVELAASHS